MNTNLGKMFEDMQLDDALHLSQSATDMAKPLSIDKTESFSQWLDDQGDALADPTSFDEWLRQNDDSL